MPAVTVGLTDHRIALQAAVGDFRLERQITGSIGGQWRWRPPEPGS